MESKWFTEITKFLPIKDVFIIYGNINDRYPLQNTFVTIENIIEKAIETSLPNENSPYIKIYYPDELIKELQNKRGSDFFSRFNELFSADKAKYYLIKGGTLFKNIQESRRFAEFLYYIRKDLNTEIINKAKYFILVDDIIDIPRWFIRDFPELSTIAIPRINEIERTEIAEKMLKTKDPELINIFVNQTANLMVKDLILINEMLREGKIDKNSIIDTIRLYKLGIKDNPWKNINREKINNANNFLSRRVIGQDEAVEKSVKIIKRAYFNLSGSQFSPYSGKPKGILFFAGPTGVGKTELAKSITEMLFGSTDSYIRFDMSEFSQEHTDQRLIGSPPGYVGHEQGGELINAVRKQPYGVILFDEIEKANHKIFDIFLQILDDGRITSGRGETLFLSEFLIIFTSNLGVTEYINTVRNQKQSKISKPEFKEVIRSHIEQFFTDKNQGIGRPEILNRIGDNIIIFDFINEETAKKILRKMLDNVIKKLKIDQNITLVFSENSMEILEQIILATKEYETMGGRGVGNVLESHFINPFAEWMFNKNVEQDCTISIISFKVDYNKINFQESQIEVKK